MSYTIGDRIYLQRGDARPAPTPAQIMEAVESLRSMVCAYRKVEPREASRRIAYNNWAGHCVTPYRVVLRRVVRGIALEVAGGRKSETLPLSCTWADVYTALVRLFDVVWAELPPVCE